MLYFRLGIHFGHSIHTMSSQTGATVHCQSLSKQLLTEMTEEETSVVNDSLCGSFLSLLFLWYDCGCKGWYDSPQSALRPSAPPIVQCACPDLCFIDCV